MPFTLSHLYFGLELTFNNLLRKSSAISQLKIVGTEQCHPFPSKAAQRNYILVKGCKETERTQRNNNNKQKTLGSIERDQKLITKVPENSEKAWMQMKRIQLIRSPSTPINTINWHCAKGSEKKRDLLQICSQRIHLPRTYSIFWKISKKKKIHEGIILLEQDYRLDNLDSWEGPQGKILTILTKDPKSQSCCRKDPQERPPYGQGPYNLFTTPHSLKSAETKYI